MRKGRLSYFRGREGPLRTMHRFLRERETDLCDFYRENASKVEEARGSAEELERSFSDEKRPMTSQKRDPLRFHGLSLQ